jgi:K+-transporting ATPase ATPase C chain
MKEAFRTSFLMLATMTVLTGVVYPLAITALAQVSLPHRANGSLVVRDGRAVGSSLVGQPFRSPGHFWGRPSATSPTPYNAASSGGSNLGSLNPTLQSNVRSHIDELRSGDPSIGRVPVDLVTASGSGLDPHISPAAAEVQVPRVAKARGKSEAEIRRLVTLHTEGRQFGLLGEPRVNVLMLNLALDHPHHSADAPWKVSVPTHHVMPSEGPHELRTHMDLRQILRQPQ